MNGIVPISNMYRKIFFSKKSSGRLDLSNMGIICGKTFADLSGIQSSHVVRFKIYV